MKTITVTTQNAINYGAVLQAYALNNTLRTLGVDDRLLDLSRMQKSFFVKVRGARNIIYALYSNLKALRYYKDLKKKYEKFENFVNKNIVVTDNYKTMEDVVNNPPSADVYITGGDQMFNYTSVLRPTNYLEFGDECVRRVSYSTSLGKNEVMEGHMEDFKQKLQRYEHISLRESKSKTFVEKIIGKEVNVNIDPSLLLEAADWRKIAKKRQRGKYIFCYCLLENEKLQMLIDKMKEKTGLPVVVLNPNVNCFVKADEIIRDAGPEEFLGLIDSADYVISTSFHGVCFSVIFEKPFYCLVKPNDVRYESLLEMLGLEDRKVESVETLAEETINYKKVKNIIKSEREKSIEYLKMALGI